MVQARPEIVSFDDELVAVCCLNVRTRLKRLVRVRTEVLAAIRRNRVPMVGTGAWMSVIPYRSTTVRVERLAKGWRLTSGAKAIERRTLVEAFEELLGHSAGQDEMSVVVAALTSATVVAPADAALTRERRSLDLE